MSAWDKLNVNPRRGAGGRSVAIEFPGSEIGCHMSVFVAHIKRPTGTARAG